MSRSRSGLCVFFFLSVSLLLLCSLVVAQTPLQQCENTLSNFASVYTPIGNSIRQCENLQPTDPNDATTCFSQQCPSVNPLQPQLQSIQNGVCYEYQTTSYFQEASYYINNLVETCSQYVTDFVVGWVPWNFSGCTTIPDCFYLAAYVAPLVVVVVLSLITAFVLFFRYYRRVAAPGYLASHEGQSVMADLTRPEPLVSGNNHFAAHTPRFWCMDAYSFGFTTKCIPVLTMFTPILVLVFHTVSVPYPISFLWLVANVIDSNSAKWFRDAGRTLHVQSWVKQVNDVRGTLCFIATILSTAAGLFGIIMPRVYVYSDSTDVITQSRTAYYDVMYASFMVRIFEMILLPIPSSAVYYYCLAAEQVAGSKATACEANTANVQVNGQVQLGEGAGPVPP